MLHLQGEPGVEKKFLKVIMHFHYMTIMAMPQHKKPCPGDHEIYIIGAAFPGNYNYMSIYLVYLLYVQE